MHSHPIPYCKVECKHCAVARLCLPMTTEEIPEVVFDDVVNRKIILKAGNALFRTNHPFKSFYAVRSGFLKSVLITKDGREQITGFYFPGELIGFDAVNSGYYNATLETLTDCEVCEISYGKMIELSNTTPSLQKHIIKLMSQRINHINCIRPNSQAKEKLASFLLNFINRIDRPRQTQKTYTLPMKRSDIGNHIGLSAETVTRTLTILKQENILSCSGKTITILDFRALQIISCSTDD